MTDNTQELEQLIRSVLTPNSYIVPKEGIELIQAILDWHNKQVKNAVVTAEDNLDQYWNKELDKQIEGVLDRLSNALTGSNDFRVEPSVKLYLSVGQIVSIRSAIEAERKKLKERTNDQL